MKYLKRFGFCVAVLSAVAIVVLAILHYVALGQLNARIADLKERGYLIEKSQLSSTRPADTEFYSGPFESSIWGFFMSAEAGASHQPNAANPRDWPWFDVSLSPSRAFSLAPGEDSDILNIVASEQALINRLKTLAAQPPVAPQEFYERFTDKYTVWAIPIPSLLGIRSFANLLALDAYAHARAGRGDDALSSCCAILRLSSHLRDQGFLISQMIGVAVVGIGLECMAGVTTLADFSEEQVAFANQTLQDSLRKECKAASLKWEMYGCNYAFETIAHRNPIEFLQEDSWLNRAAYRLYGSPLATWLRCKDNMYALEYFTRAIDLSKVPWHESAALRDEAQAFVDNIPRYAFISRLMFPNYLRVLLQYTQHEALIGQAHIALALNRYRQVHGVYPDTLDMLTPTFLPLIPLDPFTNAPFRYKLTAEGYRIWSPGADGQDDSENHLSLRKTSPPTFIAGFPDELVWFGWLP